MKTKISFFEQNGGTYTLVGDVLLPDLSIGEAEQRPIGKSSMLAELGAVFLPRKMHSKKDIRAFLLCLIIRRHLNVPAV